MEVYVLFVIVHDMFCLVSAAATLVLTSLVLGTNVPMTLDLIYIHILLEQMLLEEFLLEQLFIQSLLIKQILLGQLLLKQMLL